jgi:hypothetical protein
MRSSWFTDARSVSSSLDASQGKTERATQSWLRKDTGTWINILFFQTQKHTGALYLCHDRLKTVPQAKGPLVHRILENEIGNHLRNFSVENQGSCGGPREKPSLSPLTAMKSSATRDKKASNLPQLCNARPLSKSRIQICPANWDAELKQYRRHTLPLVSRQSKTRVVTIPQQNLGVQGSGFRLADVTAMWRQMEMDIKTERAPRMCVPLPSKNRDRNWPLREVKRVTRRLGEAFRPHSSTR